VGKEGKVKEERRKGNSKNDFLLLDLLKFISKEEGHRDHFFFESLCLLFCHPLCCFEHLFICETNLFQEQKGGEERRGEEREEEEEGTEEEGRREEEEEERRGGGKKRRGKKRRGKKKRGKKKRGKKKRRRGGKTHREKWG